MRRLANLIVTLTCVLGSLSFAYGQIESRNTVPDTITACYMNSTAFNRYTRQPMHIENLIAIIRKIEQKTLGQWDMRRIARTLVHRFMFDGMEFYPDSKLELQYRQKPEERAKSLMVKALIPIPPEEIFPDYVLDNDEKCALHWMLSHSMNATVRAEELSPYGYNPIGGTGGSNPYNPMNNNNNNIPNNNNPSMGNNYYNRGKREAGESTGEETSNEDKWDWSSEDNSKADDDIMNENKSSENNQKSVLANNIEYDDKNEDDDNDDYSAEKNSDFATQNATASNSTVVENNSLENQSAETESPKLDLPQDSDVDLLPLPSGRTAGSSKSARQVSPNLPGTTRRPIETGVVYTTWGSISAGRLLAGIAAGLEPVTMSITGGNTYTPQSSYGGSNPWSGGSGLGTGSSWGTGASSGGAWGSGNTPFKSTGGFQPNNNQFGAQPNPQAPQRWGRRKRQVQNLQPIESLYAATLAGDVGQAAILNAVNKIENVSPPRGAFNNTVCPREYILYSHPDPSKEVFEDASAWSYLTEAEIRGGLDGIILGSNIRRWDPSFTLRLSDILSMYYSQNGIAGESNFRSCDRSSLLSQSFDANRLREQSRSFAYVYNNRTNGISDQQLTSNPNLFDRLVDEAYQKMYGVTGSFGSIDRGCSRRPTSGGVVSENDNEKEIVPKLTVYGVLDHSGTINEIEQQKEFLGQLASELQVSPTGSRLGVVDGNSGTILISPNWTDSSSILACRVMSLPTQMKSQDYSRVLTNMKTELERVKTDELRYNYTTDTGIVILLMVQGKRLDDSQKNDIRRLTGEIQNAYGDVSVIAASNRYQESDFDGIKLVKIRQGSDNMSEYAPEFTQSLIRNSHGALKYQQCNAFQYVQDYEHKLFKNLFISPGQIQYYKISPDYFFSGRNLMLRFSSDNGKVRVCHSRSQPYPNQQNGGGCAETKGNWIAPGRSEIDVEFTFKQPCGKHGKREGCEPIYLSITPTAFSAPGETGLDCSVEGCQSSNQVKVTFTHWDMRCNGAAKTFLSSTSAIFTVVIALLSWLKTTV